MSTKWTMITGASDPLGVEFARLAAAEGRDLILVSQQAAGMEGFAEQLRARHKIAVEILPVDLSDPAAVEQLWRRAEMRRHIDVLVNTAEIRSGGPFTGPEFEREMSAVMVNVTACTILMKRAVAHMARQGGGRILNLSSAAAFAPGADMAVYHATKAYILSLTEAVAGELNGGPVSVTALCPGMVATSTGQAARDAALPQDAARRIARAGWKAMLKGRRIRVIGARNMLLALSRRFAPRAVMMRLPALFAK